MLRKKIPLILKLSLLCISPLAAQQTTENTTSLDVNIKSPNVASMERYGNIPVSLFTGVPNINVPIYEILVGNHSLPISVSYHASGIQNDDASSDVGLGWNLSAGYSISRVLRGKPDEHGYVNNNGAAEIPSTGYNASTYSNQQSYRNAVNNIVDVEPDEFNFSLGGYTGKFIMSPSKIVIMPDQDLKIERTTVNGNFYFTITDPHGVKYYFNDASTSHFEGCGDFGGTWDYNSSWSISKIVFPDILDSLVFNYTTETMQLPNFSQSVNYDYNFTAPDPPKFHECQSYNIITEKKISSIVFPEGTVNFHYAVPKLEITNLNFSPKAIDYININDAQGSLFRRISFVYSYYNPTSSNNLAKRLKLDSMYSTSSTGLISNRYAFGYKGTNIAPYQSKGKDDWGYYNGATNTSLIPGNRYQVSDGSGVNFFVPGGNRDVDSAYSSIGVLNKIYYPTGGNTAFEYENNTYGNQCGGDVIDTVFTTVTKTVNAVCTGNTSPFQHTNFLDFVVPFNQTTQVIVTTNQFNCTGDTRNFFLKDLTTNAVICQGINSVGSVQLVGGHNYRLQAVADCQAAEANMLNCQEQINANLSYRAATTTVKKFRFGGGLRVKKISDYDPYSGQVNVKKYSYEMPNEADRSSGILTYVPDYDYAYHYLYEISGGGGGTSQAIYNNVTSLCFTSAANNTSQNEILGVAYQYVRETIGETGEGGSTLNGFSFPHRACNFGFPFSPQSSRYYRNGRQVLEQVINSAGVIQQQTNNYYSYVDNDFIQGWKVAYTQMRAKNGTGFVSSAANYTYDDHFMGTLYNYYSQKERLDSTIVTNFYEPSSSVVVKRYNQFFSNSSYYPYKTMTFKSDGLAAERITWRSSDLTLSPTSGLSGASYSLRYMLDNHLNDYEFETYSLVNGLVTDASITEYTINDLGLRGKKILPSKIYSLQNQTALSNYTPLARNLTANYTELPKDSRMLLESTCIDYTPNGSPKYITGLGGKATSFLYGYNDRKPVARIYNINQQALNIFLANNPTIQATLNNPSNDQSLLNAVNQVRLNFPNSMISAYTYKPFVGMTSETDANNRTATYEYDSYGRLINIKDQDGNIIKNTTYQIQGPQ